MNRRLFVSLVFSLMLFSSVGTVFALSLTVNAPMEDDILDSRTVSLDLESDEDSDFFLFRNILRSRRPVSLCDNVMTCMDTFRAREGENNIIIKIINDGGEVDSKDISFTVDSRAPKIIRAMPRNNAWVNTDTDFSIKYNEDHVEDVVLFYGNKIKKRTTCPSGRKQTCSVNPSIADLSMFDGQDILYHFEMNDSAGHNVSSQVRTIHVDTTDPDIESVDRVVDGRRVTFTVEVEEENFDKILIRDNNARRPRWTRLCSRLTVGVCTRTKSFRPGTHNIDVMVLDKAGNSDEDSFDEFVI